MSELGFVFAMTAFAIGLGIGMIIVLIGVLSGGAFCGGAPPHIQKERMQP